MQFLDVVFEDSRLENVGPPGPNEQLYLVLYCELTTLAGGFIFQQENEQNVVSTHLLQEKALYQPIFSFVDAGCES